MTATSKTRQAERRRDAQAAAIKARLERQRRRNRMIVGGAVAAVIAVVAVIVVVSAVSSGGGGSSSATVRAAVPASVMQQVTGVPAATLAAVGTGTVKAIPSKVNDPALTANGKPLVLYIGAEYCPYCAAQRWPLVQALSRFGTFTGLRTTHSASDDVFPNTQTFTFYGATYTSDYLSFQGPELATNQRQGGTYTPLEKLTDSQAQILKRYGGGTPLLDIGGRYIAPGASYDPAVLSGKSVEDIAGSLAKPSSTVAKAVDGTANVLTAAICKVTGGSPGNVCSSAAVTAAAAKLGG